MTGDDDAARFAVFYRDHYSLILATCYRRLADYSAAEDATAEVFRIAWQRYNKEDPSLPTLYAIARNVIGNEYRRSSRAHAAESRLEQAALTAAPDDDPIELRDALLHLRPADRELLKGILEGLTIECHLTLANIAQLTELDADDLERALRDPRTVPVEKKYELAVKGSYLINAVNQARRQ